MKCGRSFENDLHITIYTTVKLKNRLVAGPLRLPLRDHTTEQD